MAGLTMQFTNYGLNALASAPSGGYVAPQYLVIDTTHSTLAVAGGGALPVGATSVQVATPSISQPGDTQLVLGVGTANQETVTFSGTPTLSGGVYVYNLTAGTLYSHNNGDICVRQPTVNDSIASIGSEMQVDPTYFPNQRIVSAYGYNNGTGIWVLQMYVTGTQANGYIAIVGLADSVTIGAGHLHAVGVVGIDHSFANGSNTNDLEIDAIITIANG